MQNQAAKPRHETSEPALISAEFSNYFHPGNRRKKVSLSVNFNYRKHELSQLICLRSWRYCIEFRARLQYRQLRRLHGLQPGWSRVNQKGYVTCSYNVRHARRKNNFDDFVTFLKHSSATALHGLQAGWTRKYPLTLGNVKRLRGHLRGQTREYLYGFSMYPK